MKRFESTSRAAMINHLSSTLNGLATIRSAQRQTDFVHKFQCLQDEHSSVWFALLSVKRLVSTALDLISLTFVAWTLFATLIYSIEAAQLSAGLIAILVLMVGFMPSTSQYVVHRWVELDTSIG